MVKSISIKKLVLMKYEQAFTVAHMQIINRICIKTKIPQTMCSPWIKIAKKFHLSSQELCFLCMIFDCSRNKNLANIEEFLIVSAWILKNVTSSRSVFYNSIIKGLVKCPKTAIFGWLLNHTINSSLNLFRVRNRIYCKEFGITTASIQRLEFDINQFINRLAQQLSLEIIEESFQLIRFEGKAIC
ncbi:unnamed protein product [Blepharisma stoltei]|uniref:Uncharacterized protein n=1 Tax=Blepharisma stoltei TaxID=1481888 RepID=A0AAU9ICW7_9CILI|nr:unnamed protein product [Blepharisma stoltei]